MSPDVILAQTEPRYPESLDPTADTALSQGLRALWSAWGKDPDNPFKDWVAPGGRIVIKPNWVMHANPLGHNLDSLLTHPSLIAHVIEAAARAMNGRGTVVVGDAPLQDCNFPRLIERSRIPEVVQEAKRRHPALDLVVEDWRLTLMAEQGEGDGTSLQRARSGYAELAANNYNLMDLGTDSFLDEVSDYADRFRVTNYKPSLMGEHHHPGKHEYLITKRVFDADLVINLPKMKTHKRAGVTGALKNLVGINGHKEYLPHHVQGAYFDGGDCHCTSNLFTRRFDASYDCFWEKQGEMSWFKRRLHAAWLRFLWVAGKMAGGDGIGAASWSGNDTVWRMTLDLNHLLYFSPTSSKKVISLLDGVIAGEGDGPISPTPKPLGVLIAGENPAYVDAVMTKLMGYSIARVPTVYHAIYNRQSRFLGPALRDWAITWAVAGRAPERVPFGRLPDMGFVKPVHWRRAGLSDGTNGHQRVLQPVAAS